MNQLRAFWLKVRLLWQRREMEREIDEELRFHLEQRTAENLAAGMSPEDAAREARKRFGNVQTVREECRETRGAHFGETVVQDICFGLRMLRKSPGYTAIAVLALALGIGGTTAVFSVVNAVVLRSLPYPDPGRLISVSEVDPQMPDMIFGVTPGSYIEARRECRSFSNLAAMREGQKLRIKGVEETQQATGARVTGDFFRVMGVPAKLGRALVPEDARPGTAPTAVISQRLWQRVFGGDPAVIGRTLETEQASIPIVGVMPAAFAMPANCDVWLPLELDATGSSDYRTGELSLIGRLATGATLDQCLASLKVLNARQVPTAHSAQTSRQELRGCLLEDTQRDGREMELLLLWGAVGLLLAISTANVANLQLVQAASRMREVSIRLSLGATRGRLLRQFLVESLLLSLLGGGAGVVAALLGQGVVVAEAAKVMPRAMEASLDGRVLLFAFLLSVVTGMTVGLLAVWRIGRTTLTENLRARTAGIAGDASGRQWLYHGLAGAQVALSLTLLLGAGLLMRSLMHLWRKDLGLEPRGVLVISLGGGSAEVLERLRALPGVVAAAATDARPFAGTRNVNGPIQIEGLANPEDANPMALTACVPMVTADYFGAMGMRWVSGESIQAGDGQADSDIVVNEAFVKRFLQGTVPIGKQVKLNSGSRGHMIAGVVRNAQDQGARRSPWPTIYFLTRFAAREGETHVILRSASANQRFLTRQVRDVVRTCSPRVPILSIRTMDELVGESVAKDRLSTLLYGTFAGLALALCLVGIYGVMSYSVAQRTKEFGVRMALGALKHQVALLPLRQALPLLTASVLIGLLGACGLGRLLASQLFQVKPLDPATFLVTTAIFLAAAASACWIPACRAARIDPMEALRCE